MKAKGLALKNETPEQKIERLERQINERDQTIEKLGTTVEKLSNELIALRRRMFGRSSERFVPEDPSQLSLAFDGQECIPEETTIEVEAEKIEITYTRNKENNRKPVRTAIPDSIRREEVVIEPENIPQGAVRIGEEVTEKLEYLPGEVFVKRIIRPKYALPKGEGIQIADLPTQILPRSNAGASLLAYILVSKFVDHIPFHRILEIFKRQQISLPASTVNDWSANSIDQIRPLYYLAKKQVTQSDYIMVDESTIPVLDRDHPGATRKGYHWIVRSPMLNMLFFHYDKGSRAQRVVVELLHSFQGAVQSDAYGAYNIYETKKGVLLLGCWAHARRKFEQALDNDPQRATLALKYIREMYAIERESKEAGLTFSQIKEIREEKSYPIIRDFEKWLLENITQVLPKSLIGKAIAYTYNIYPRLARYVLDGRYKIDNNDAENGVRPLALGRKNYLFCGNNESSERTAIIYTLMGCCKLAGVNPLEWLTDVLNRLPDHSAKRIEELLPINWKPIEK
ncbi:MAG: IS66 family transposase [Prolixibacteraceae bacterium]|nr:IS66 family transposase [Prolixibacteraceae bacterium]